MRAGICQKEDIKDTGGKSFFHGGGSRKQHLRIHFFLIIIHLDLCSLISYTKFQNVSVLHGQWSGHLSCSCLSIVLNQSDRDLWHHRAIFCAATASHWIVWLFSSILCKPKRWFCMKISLKISIFRNTTITPYGANKYSRIKTLSFPFWCLVGTTSSHLHQIQRPKYFELHTDIWKKYISKE